MGLCHVLWGTQKITCKWASHEWEAGVDGLIGLGFETLSRLILLFIYLFIYLFIKEETNGRLNYHLGIFSCPY